MSAKTLEGRIVTAPDRCAGRTKVRKVWRIAAFLAFVLSGFFFISGFVVSLATAVGAVPLSRGSAYLTVALLLSGFASASFGAHGLDKIDETRGDNGPTD